MVFDVETLVEDYKLHLRACSEEDTMIIFNKLAYICEADLFKFADFPEILFSFFLDLFQEQEFYSKKGVWTFLVLLSSKTHRLSSDHYKRLEEVFVQNYADYKCDDLRLSVCYFIVQQYESNYAEELLLSLVEKEKALSSTCFSQDALVRLERQEVLKIA